MISLISEVVADRLGQGPHWFKAVPVEEREPSPGQIQGLSG